MICGGFLAQADAVGEQLHLGLVGIDGNAAGVLHPVDVPLAADVHEGLVAEPGLVGVEGILLILAVEGDQALVVHAVFAALVAAVGGKVEHVPHVGGPDGG